MYHEMNRMKLKEKKFHLILYVFKLNNELRPIAIFKQVGSVVNEQTRPTAALRILANGLSSTRLVFYIDTLEPEYNPRPAPHLIYHKECSNTQY